MPSITKLSAGASILTLAVAASFSTAAFANKHMTPLPGQTAGHVGPVEAPYVAPSKAKSGTWTALNNKFPGSTPDTAMLLTDGSVLMHDGCTANWYRLSPDSKGSYQNGTWKKTASMSGYQPLYFSSQVMADGRVMVNGGEYDACSAVWTNKGAMYDPVKDSWTTISAPSGWSTIGDAQSVVLSDGTYFLANCCTSQQVLATIKGTSVTWKTTGTGKGDINDEEGWTILPDQTVLTVDANRDLSTGHNDCERYSQDTGKWTACANTVNSVVDAGSHELGPAPLLPNGLVFQLGATTNNEVYDPLMDKWYAAPSFPGSGDAADGPVAVLPDGNVLAQVSPGVFNTPSHFFEVSVKSAKNVSITQVNDPATAPQQSSYEGRLMLLPTGQVLWSSDVGDVEIYTPQGKPAKNAIPVVKKVSASLKLGSTNNSVKGTGFNGVTFGGYYGDDAEMATNYPIVRITNTGSGNVCYARTHDHATMGISDGKPTSTKFDIPSSCDKGASTLEVVANGVASKPKSVTIN